eukprot:TRINITY_DN5611_c0_g1_i1.p1 TRINITY_DN5611_c0_g1~~TRINITY_DN5611_c0_g1_i1.p1  ORF type:complete len:809 (-),score=83.19 TRINITY_DN5611_c0_g1_i1:496-2859(-)
MECPASPTLSESFTLGQNRIPLYPGESVLQFYPCSIRYAQLDYDSSGLLYMTNFKLHFQGDDLEVVSVPLNCILSVVEPNKPSYWSVYQTDVLRADLQITTKDVRAMTFTFASDEQRMQAQSAITQRAFWDEQKMGYQTLFAFSYNQKALLDPSEMVTRNSCWYIAEEEFERQGLKDSPFHLSNINKDYTLCPSYPKKLVFPKAATEEILRSSAQFRSSSRLPAISWVHPQTYQTISRCSQPLTGMGGQAFDTGDEILVSLLYSKSHPNISSSGEFEKKAADNYRSLSQSDPVKRKNQETSSVKLYIVDARSHLVARCNYVNGGGHEAKERYPGCEVCFKGIENIHQIRTSFQGLCRLIVSQTPERSLIEQTGWLRHIRLVLEAAYFVAEAVCRHNKSVLVHCSDGWDRTTQIVSLAQLLIDPFYRTVRGFGILIQKEWLSFGHKFGDRIGHGRPEDCNEQSPIFVQFIDVVYQILRQYPNWFEFNEAYLIALLDELYKGRFGTFLMDNDRSREEAGVLYSTHSIWPWLMHSDRIKRFTNIEYTRFDGLISPNCTSSHLNVWMSYYGRYGTSMLQHQLHEEHTLKNNLARQLAGENAKLKMQLEREAARRSAYESLLREQILTQTDLRQALEDQILCSNISHEDLEVVVHCKNGQITFQLKDLSHSSKLPIQERPFKFCNQEGIVIIDDYTCPSSKTRCFLPCSSNSGNVASSPDTDPEDGFLVVDSDTLQQQDYAPGGLQRYVTTAYNIVSHVPYVAQAGNAAYNLLPACRDYTISLGCAVGWLKS